MKTDRRSQDYCRNVMAYLVSIENEDDSMLKDIAGVGIDFDIRRATIDGVISNMWDEDMKRFCSAMQIADISARQAAQAISAMAMLQGRGKS